MLLLVLVLVLIAFGLLVVALLSGSVLWAWVSVGVSVTAAGVLLVDWLQRRSAVRAGDDAAMGAQAADAEPRAPGDAESVTQFLPVVPPSAPDGEPPGVNGVPQEGAETRFDPSQDVSRTVVMPTVKPSGSAERPSGAAPPPPPRSGDPSLSVTEAGSERPPGSAGTEGGAVAEEPAGATSAPSSVVAPGAREPAGASGADLFTGVEPGRGEQVEPGRGEQTVRAPVEPGPGDSAPSEPVPAAEERPDAPPAAASSPVAAPPYAPSQGASPQGAPPARDDPVAHPPPAARSDVSAGGAPPPDDPPLGADGELPEEPHDGPLAALVAGLEDEVVVVDEQPRYHVAGCRSLAGSPLIPLPVREAVELGFSPCGWCTPARTLAGRHPAQTH